VSSSKSRPDPHPISNILLRDGQTSWKNWETPPAAAAYLQASSTE